MEAAIHVLRIRRKEALVAIGQFKQEIKKASSAQTMAQSGADRVQKIVDELSAALAILGADLDDDRTNEIHEDDFRL